MRFFGRDSLPSDVRASLREHLSAEGVRSPLRVLTFARTSDGVVIALPDRLALWERGAWRTVAWHEMMRAAWAEDGHTFRWTTVPEPDTWLSVAVEAPGELPGVVRERIEQTFVVRQSVELAPGKRGVVAARRPAEGGGALVWYLVPDRGVDLTRPDLAEAARRILDRLMRDWS